ncbi:hypothetical protein GWI33_017785 [Rhynchophorus ferrugineus]|uniref:Uncharacterized protein n=1 Tax=Rhynchophorus ferrugineus TaxID=354439 RepID=A0A834HXI5_RHYFE|nr:hypothetical protein GWI33_017785 [Rhynchophorus ferrugineus]
MEKEKVSDWKTKTVICVKLTVAEKKAINSIKTFLAHVCHIGEGTVKKSNRTARRNPTNAPVGGTVALIGP